jgi:hypothetical protein
MLPHYSIGDPRHPQYKWKKIVAQHWADWDTHRVRRLDLLAARLHNALGPKWDVRREEGSYSIELRDSKRIVGILVPWKTNELIIAFRAEDAGAYEAAGELSPKVLGCWMDEPENRFYCAAVPGEGQEDEILLAVHDHVRDFTG